MIGDDDAAERRALLAIGPIDLSPASIDLAPDLNQSDRARVDHFLARASADATLRAYRSDWRLFTTWCDTRGYASLPASPIVTAAFLSELARDGSAHSNGRPLSKSSIGRRLAAIVFAHRAAELEPPTVQAGAAALDRVMRGIRNAKRSDRPAKKRPADSDVLRDMVRHITGSTLIDYRDRALLSIGMMGAFRRSELVAIDVADVADDPRGLLVTIPFSKGDQEGRGQTVAVLDGRRMEPVRHYRAWLEAAGITDGPVFRRLTPHGRLTDKPLSPQTVALVVKARAAAAGYDPALFSGHSLRAGFLTEAGRHGANLFKMKEHSRHKSLEMLSEYVRDQEAFRNHAGEGFA
ncbi:MULTISPECIES: site-specific integrase [Sphingomonas]|jgi:integrase|uniref:Integrase n=1 Tax=Sphingomonas yabuuchiae TaxID=172044 RepID=A0AA41A024_9SPHN|nr:MULTISPECIES: site-specific integrase [Sphingomonas]MBB4610529.1 integrase [Sphingomonas yabuuchiae]MBN3557528.1 tyrosine-type recombinase/integrase [Sphingomonas yabuuchiae]